MILQLEQIARNRAETGRQRDGWQAGRLGLLNPIERDRHAPLRGDHVRSPLQQRRRQVPRDLPWETWQLRRGGRSGRRVPAEQELERANRLLTSELQLAQDVTIVRDADARDEDLPFIADPDERSSIGQAHELLVRTNGLACRLDLQPRLGREEPALGHERRNRLSRVLEIRLRRRRLSGARRPAVAHPAPEVELPLRGEDAALHARAVARQLAAAAREQIDRRVQLRPRKLGVELRLLDTRGGHAKIDVVSDGFGHRRGQPVVFEPREPAIDRSAGAGAAPSTARASAPWPTPAL